MLAALSLSVRAEDPSAASVAPSVQPNNAGVAADPGNLKAYREMQGQEFQFEITGASMGAVWGTDIYTDDSPLSLAAVHAGVVEPGQRAIVTVKILPGQVNYTSSRQNGVLSRSQGKSPGSYQILGATLIDPAPVAPAADPGNLRAYRNMQGKELQFDITGASMGAVWGTDIYTDDSPLSLAAVHAGYVKPGERAIVTVKILPGQANYTSSRQNGVLSRSQGKSSGSYQILGAQQIAPAPERAVATATPEVTGPAVNAASATTPAAPAPTPKPAALENEPAPTPAGPEVSSAGQPPATPPKTVSTESPSVPTVSPAATAAQTEPVTKVTPDETEMNTPPPAPGPKSSSKEFGFFDLLELLMVVGYTIGVFVLLPLVILTNIAERTVPQAPVAEGITPGEEFTDDDTQARDMMDQLADELPDAENEDGTTYKTITSGSQARKARNVLVEIGKNLHLTNTGVLEQFDALRELYQVRSRRVYTGSFWVLACAAAILVLFYYSGPGGIDAFMVIHLLGMIFYTLASRAPVYLLEKRSHRLSTGGLMGAVIGGVLFSSTRYYNVYSDGHKERNYEQEAGNTLFGFLLMAVFVIFCGFLIGVFGVISFIMNYSTSIQLPFKLKLKKKEVTPESALT
jgi:hypothetical protein